MSPRQRAEHAIVLIRAFAATRVTGFAGLIGGAALGAGLAVAAWPPTQVAATATEQPSAAAATLPCDQQTWPYLDASCLKAGSGRPRQIRLLSTDRDVPSTLRTVTVSGKAITHVTAADTAPEPSATVVAMSAAPVAQTVTPSAPARSAVKPPRTTERWTARRSVTVHYGRKFADRGGRRAPRSRYRVAGPIDLTPGRDAAAPERRWNDTSRRVMAYGDDDGPAARSFFVPRENGFGRPLFFGR